MTPNTIMKNIFQMPLYQKFVVNDEVKATLTGYFDNRDHTLLTFDIYCIHCKSDSIYNPFGGGQLCPQGITHLASHNFFSRKIPFGTLHYCCARNNEHFLRAQIMLDGEHVIKIGQYPSKADIEHLEFNRFSKTLPEEQLLDLRKSAGLVSHGVGTGSFVYLRRVFEHLLKEAHDKAAKKQSFQEDEYGKSRVVEKIKLLKDYLPSSMVDNASAYSILSKGVHELSEEECLGAYGLIKDTIELVLDEILAKKEREAKEDRIKKDISALNSKLKSP